MKITHRNHTNVGLFHSPANLRLPAPNLIHVSKCQERVDSVLKPAHFFCSEYPSSRPSRRDLLWSGSTIFSIAGPQDSSARSSSSGQASDGITGFMTLAALTSESPHGNRVDLDQQADDNQLFYDNSRTHRKVLREHLRPDHGGVVVSGLVGDVTGSADNIFHTRSGLCQNCFDIRER